MSSVKLAAENKKIHIAEKQALLELFKATNGNSWNDNSSWCSDKPLHSWKGVKIDYKNGRVQKLILPENNLTGTYSIKLTSQWLKILPRLLVGELPGEAFRSLTNLTEIDFRSNKLTGFNIH
jgi:hypothetical protein